MSAVSNDSDPRGEPAAVSERSVRPVVARPARGFSGAVITGIAIAAGLLLFVALDAKRRSGTAPSISRQAIDQGPSAALPQLALPANAAPEEPPLQTAAPYTTLVQGPIGNPLGIRIGPAPPPQPQASYQPLPVAPTAPAQPDQSAGGSALISDTRSSQGAGKELSTDKAPSALGPPVDTDRAMAGTLANKSTTVPQGTVISAVLETAFDSTSPGFARAMVQRDIRGFDGTLVLIPRGSHLIGEYGADTSQGQSRAVIAWSRLIRPDGTTIAIGSPVTDPVGRNGIKATVNSHFFERFTGAILQSTLDVGVNLASRSTRSPVIVALPGATQGISNVIRPTEIRPTLRVAQGTSVSVFVARDLDFTGAETQK